MTEDEKTAIDACKDQAAKEAEFKDWNDLHLNTFAATRDGFWHRAMLLYGEQCRKEALGTLKEMIIAERDDAIEQQQAEQREEYNEGVEAAAKYCIELIEKLTAQA